MNQMHNVHEGQHSNSGSMMMPGATPSSSIHPRGAGGSNHEYFQSYGDSSTHYGTNNNNNSRDQSITQQNLPREGAAGGGVVHTVTSNTRNTGMVSTIAGMESSMMSAESGSTALLDRGAGAFNNRGAHGGPINNFISANQNTGVASMGGQARGQTSSI